MTTSKTIPPQGAKAVETNIETNQSLAAGSHRGKTFPKLVCGLLVLLGAASTGCQMDIAGQTLPSPYYLTDDVQYYAPGPEFKLAREAAALEEQRAAHASQHQR